MSIILEVKGLTRYYSPLLYRIAKRLQIKAIASALESKVQRAVDDISFGVKGGEICGFLGPNGAGKSTAIKSIVGLIYKDSGNIYINGKSLDSSKTEILNYVGGVIETPVLYKNLSGRDNLKYFATLRGGVEDRRIEEVLKIVDLSSRVNDKFSKYSMGMKQRLGIAQAIMHKPKLLLLDEPANGLDPQGIIDLRKLLKKLAHEEGMAIIVSSHQLSEMQLMCDRVLIMNKGKIIGDKTIDELSNSNEGLVQVTFVADKIDEAIKLINDKYKAQATATGNSINVNLDKELVPEVTKELLLSGIMVSGVKIKENTLEDLFVELTGGGKNA